MRVQERLHDSEARLRAHRGKRVGVPRNLLCRSFAFDWHLLISIIMEI
jgi:hypothetical protein